MLLLSCAGGSAGVPGSFGWPLALLLGAELEDISTFGVNVAEEEDTPTRPVSAAFELKCGRDSVRDLGESWQRISKIVVYDDAICKAAKVSKPPQVGGV